MNENQFRTLFIAITVTMAAALLLTLPGQALGETAERDPLWDYEAGDTVGAVAVTPDGKYIAVGTDYGKILFFESENPDPIWVSEEASDRIGSIAISNNGEYLVAGSDDQRIFFFDTSSSSPVWTYEESLKINDVDISGNGEYIITGSANWGVRFFSKDSEDPLWSHSTEGWGSPSSVAISFTGDHMVMGTTGGNVSYFAKESNEPLWTFEAGTPEEVEISQVDMTSDGKYAVAGADNDKAYLFERDGTGEPIQTYDAGNPISTLSLADDARYLVAGDDQGGVHLFEKASAPALWSASLGQHITSVAISSNGKNIVAGSDDHSVYFFDKDSNEAIWSYTAEAKVTTVSLSTNAEVVAAGSEDDKLRVFMDNEIPDAWIDTSLIPDPAELGEEITFSGSDSSDDDEIVEYLWDSDADGILYRGPEPQFETDNLSMGDHLVTLLVKDSYGQWSEPDQYQFMVIPPEVVDSDYQRNENPTPLLFKDSFVGQDAPAIYDGIVVWEDTRYGDKDVFMFDLDEDDEVRMLSYPSFLLSDPDSFEYVGQENPAIHGDTVVWAYYNSSEDSYYIYSYDLKDKDWGGEELLELDARPLHIAVSDRWITWTYLDFTDWENLFTLQAYNRQSKAVTEVFAFDGEYSLHGDQIIWVRDNGTFSKPSSNLIVYDLLVEDEMENVTVYASSTDVENMDFSDSYLVWEDHRDDEAYGSGDSNIFLIDLEAEQEAQLTFDTSTQKEPKLSGDYLVWLDNRDGDVFGVYAYSISRNKTAKLSANDTGHEGVRLYGEYAVWSCGDGNVYLYDLTQATWEPSEAVFVDLDKRQQDDGGNGGGGDEPIDILLALSNYDISEEDREDKAVAGFPGVVLIYIGVNLGVLVFAGLYVYRTDFKKMNFILATGAIVLFLILTALTPGIITKDGEDYDDWREDDPKVGDDIKMAGIINYKIERDLIGTPIYTYGLEGSDYSFHSMEDIGDEGDYVSVTVLFSDDQVIDIYETTDSGNVYIFAIYLILSLAALGFILYTFNNEYGGQFSLFGIDKVTAEESCSRCGADIEYNSDYNQFYCYDCDDFVDPAKKAKKKGKKGSPKKKASRCPSCGDRLEFIQEYKAWYCDTCADYREPKKTAGGPKGKKAGGRPKPKAKSGPKCRDCKQAMEFIPEYDRYYCHTCQRYAAPSAGKKTTPKAGAKRATGGAARTGAKGGATAGKKSIKIRCKDCGKTGNLPANAPRPLKIKCSGCGKTKVIK